ncbi:hypothetical protein M9458_056500, partial [Cirrhinus mrigala]
LHLMHLPAPAFLFLHPVQLVALTLLTQEMLALVPLTQPMNYVCGVKNQFLASGFCSFSFTIELTQSSAKVEYYLFHHPNKLRSDILEGMAEEIFSQLDQAAEALINAHPCLKEKGTHTGHEGWKHYLKIKMANFRSKLSKIGHPEITVNSRTSVKVRVKQHQTSKSQEKQR